MYNTDLPTRAELPSTEKLLWSTAIAALFAAGLLITIVLPAEFGIDPTGAGRVLGLTQMGQIKTTLAVEKIATELPPASGGPATTEAVEPSAIAEASAVAARSESASQAEGSAQQHTMTFTLKPGEAAEIKLDMRKDSEVRFTWSATGGAINYDTHGDQGNVIKYHGYSKGRNKTGDTGTLQAAFDGSHGWFWRNRSGSEVVVSLNVKGDYEKIDRVL